MPLRLRLTMLLISLSTMGSFAQTIYRVQAGQSLPTALTVAAAGDIIYVDAGNYGDINLTKKVILIGTGYFGSNSIGEATVAQVRFLPGSEGSVLAGFTTNSVYAETSNVSIVRNNTTEIFVGSNSLNAQGWMANNVVIRQNWMRDGNIHVSGLDGSGFTNNTANNVSIRNNICAGSFYFFGRVSGEVINNTFDFDNTGDPYSTYGTGGPGYGVATLPFVYKNNIFARGTTSSASFMDHNIPVVFVGNVLPSTVTRTGNTSGVDMTKLFAGYPANPSQLRLELQYTLATNSPAKGAGEGGVDAGAFGGDDPYVLNGIPFVPTITQLTVPLTVTQNGTLNVTVKAQTNN
jgi:hypothetical protein